MRLLLVEDDMTLASVIAEGLSISGYVVDIAYDGESGWSQANLEEYSVILLDFMLPKLDGVSLCKRLRSHSFRMPIILLTARDASTDIVLGLDSGADDYLVKPINLQVLLARIRAVLRRGSVEPDIVLRWGNLSLHPSNHEVSYNGEPVYLTPTEFSLLELFLRSNRRVLSRRVMIDQLWNYDDPPSEETVKVHIRGLRLKLKEAGAPGEFIRTVRGVGYQLLDCNQAND